MRFGLRLDRANAFVNRPIFAPMSRMTGFFASDISRIEFAVSFSKELKKNIVITRGEKGAIAIKDTVVYECAAKKNLKIKDLTGAGDLFAAGYLHGIINGMSIEKCLNKGTEMSSNIIQKIGARI